MQLLVLIAYPFTFLVFAGQSGACREVKCESWNYQYAECNVVENKDIKEVTVFDRVSVSECAHQEGNIAPEGYRKGQIGIYGYSRNTLWVHRGCRAWFDVCFSGKSYRKNSKYWDMYG